MTRRFNAVLERRQPKQCLILAANQTNETNQVARIQMFSFIVRFRVEYAFREVSLRIVKDEPCNVSLLVDIPAAL